MAFGQTKSILEAARHYHDQLAQYYDALAEQSTRDRVRLVLDYLRMHEAHLATSLAEYEEELPERIQQTWFKYPPELPDPVLPQAVWNDPEISAGEVIRLAHDFDTKLLTYYCTAAERASVESVRKLFLELAAFEQQEEARTLKAIFAPV